jgi:hypothetical protein
MEGNVDASELRRKLERLLNDEALPKDKIRGKEEIKTEAKWR